MKAKSKDPARAKLLNIRYTGLQAYSIIEGYEQPRLLDNVWRAVLDHSLEARGFTQDVYRLDLRGAFGQKDDAEAREMVCRRLAAGAGFPRDLAYTARAESARPVPRTESIDQPQNPDNPKYNPAAGSAPAK